MTKDTVATNEVILKTETLLSEAQVEVEKFDTQCLVQDSLPSTTPNTSK